MHPVRAPDPGNVPDPRQIRYRLPSHSTQLLQPLNVALLQKSYGNQFFNPGIYWLQRRAF